MKRLLGAALLAVGVGCDDVMGGPLVDARTLSDSAVIYDGRQVRVHGTVARALKFPFVDGRTFELRDSTGSTMVIWRRTGPPVEGATVTVSGRFTTAASYGRFAVGGHLEVADSTRLKKQ